MNLTPREKDKLLIAMAAEVMRGIGLADGEYVIRVNDRRLLDGVLRRE